MLEEYKDFLQHRQVEVELSAPIFSSKMNSTYLLQSN